MKKIERSVLVFIHIPKTGGTTVNQYLKNIFPKKIQLLGEKSLHENFIKKPLHERNQFDLITGHIAPDLSHFVSRPCLYVTFFRHPLERAISYYIYVCKTKTHHQHTELIEGKITLDQYLLNEGPHGKSKNNYMTCFLLGFDSRLKSVTPDLLDQAKEKLRDQFMFIGSNERFSDSMFILSQKLGRRPELYNSRNLQYNKFRGSKSHISRLTSEVITHFEETNSADIELYNYARQLFERQWAELSRLEKCQACIYRLKQYSYERLFLQFPQVNKSYTACKRVLVKALRPI